MLIVSLNPQICSPSFLFVLAHGCTIHPGVEASHLAIVFDFTLSHRPNISRPLSILSTLPPRYFLNLATVFYLVIIVSSKLTHDYKFPCFLCLVPVIFVAEKFMKKKFCSSFLYFTFCSSILLFSFQAVILDSQKMVSSGNVPFVYIKV